MATSLWTPNHLLDVVEVDAVIACYEDGLESHDRVVFRQGLAMARERLHAGFLNTDPRPTPAAMDAAIRRRARNGYRCELCGRDPRDFPGYGRGRLEIEHMASRMDLCSLRVPWDVIHSPSNLANACRSCNRRKGTRSLTPDQIQWMWSHHAFGASDQAEGLLLQCFANILERHAWDRLPLQEKLDPEPAADLSPPATIIAMLRSQGLDPMAVRDRYERASRAVSRRTDELWAGERPSDDNREQWGRASWQR